MVRENFFGEALKNNNKNLTVKTNPEIFAEMDKFFHIRHRPANFLNTQGSRSFSEDIRNFAKISRMMSISSEKKESAKTRKYNPVPDKSFTSHHFRGREKRKWWKWWKYVTNRFRTNIFVFQIWRITGEKLSFQENRPRNFKEFGWCFISLR